MSEYVLEILDGARAGDVISLTESRLSIGRRPSNDVVLTDEKASGQHAEVVREGEGWVLRDLESTNGTLLDGKKVTEIGLTPGDVFHIGRVRVCFRREGEAAPGAGGDLALHRIDQSRLTRVRRGSGMLGLTAALVVAVGGGAWAWLEFGRGEQRGARGGRKAPLTVAGNLVPAAVAQCETDEGWTTSAAPGDGFSATGSGHTGVAALEAHAGDGAGWALARTSEGQRVLGGDALQLHAWVQCDGGARVALRARFASSREDDPSTLVTGTEFAAADGWTELTCDVAVPPDRDRVHVEVVALLPAGEGRVAVDDVAVVKGGSATPLDLTSRNGIRLRGSGGSFRLLSAEDAALLGVHPLAVDAALRPLVEAGALAASDIGLAFDVGVEDDTFRLHASRPGLWLELPDAAPPLARADAAGAFAPMTAEGDAGRAVEILVGSGSTRMLVRVADGAPARFAPLAGGRGRLELEQAQDLELVVSFEGPRQQARERIRAAQSARAEGKPGRALALLESVAQELPHDDQVLREAQSLRTEMVAQAEARIDQLSADAAEAEFFGSRGGLRTVVDAAGDLLTRYDGAELSRLDEVRSLRDAGAERLRQAEQEAFAARAEGLQRLATAFDRSGQQALAQLVNDYLASKGAGK